MRKVSKARQRSNKLKQELALKRVAARPGGVQQNSATKYNVDLNDDVCYCCAMGGDLLLCSSCTLSFHWGVEDK